ncbi:MAG: ATP-binding protein [Actinobacteria bacterium]|nr:ATP-binding protein [Actinomycetota bacterium]
MNATKNIMNEGEGFQKFLSDLGINDILKIEEDLGNGYVRLKISEAERRQALQDIKCIEDIIVELLRNSRDAKSRNIFIGTRKSSARRIIHFIDDGVGIPPDFHNVIFESRVTSKLEDGVSDSYGFHGRGMALFSIKLNVEEIKITYSNEMRGTSIYLVANLDKIPEKKDQSILPEVVESDGKVEIRGGVNNIIKTLINFSLQNEDINIFYGTPAQILATMRKAAIRENKAPGSRKEKIGDDCAKFYDWDDFFKYIENKKVKVTEIPGLVDNYSLMEEVATRIFNMNLSTRTVQRIVYNEISPLKPLNKCYLDYLSHPEVKENFVRMRVCSEEEKSIGDEKEASSSGNNNSTYKSADSINNIDGINNIDTEHKGNLEARKSKGEKKNWGGASQGINLYDELNLIGRFKDEEVRCIISAIEEKVREIGRKYFITPGNIEIKRANNILNILIELKEKN